MYSVAFDNTVALFNLCAGVNPCKSSTLSPLFVMTLKLGTESLSAAILSLRFVRYLFSIMLCAVFLTGGCFPEAFCSRSSCGEHSSSEISSTEDFRFRHLVSRASGEDAEDGGDVGQWREGMAMERSLFSSCGVRTRAPGSGRFQDKGVE